MITIIENSIRTSWIHLDEFNLLIHEQLWGLDCDQKINKSVQNSIL